MKIIRKYAVPIVFGLAFLLVCKSCQSCSRARTIEYNEIQYTETVDSLVTINQVQANWLRAAEDSIKILNAELTGLREQKGILQGTLDETRAANTRLLNTNHNLSKSH